MTDSDDSKPELTVAARLRQQQAQQRRAEALRANLLKRKQQSRARDDGPAGDEQV